MSNITTKININIPKDLKEETTSLYERRIPFEVHQHPSKEFAEALKELDYMENHPNEYKVYHNVDKMFENILNEE